MSFSEIIGQENIIKNLKNSIINNSVVHAYIFEGSNGIGKMTMANAFAKTLFCQEKAQDACGKCKSCLMVDGNSHPDLKIITSEDSILVDVIRNMVKDVGIKPFYNDKKIFIIENAEKMTIQAQNSLLKTLEEPPENIVIILTTSNKNLLLPTIISRCVTQKFVKNTNQQVEQFIKQKYPEHFNNSKVIVSLSDGIIGNAEDIININNFNELREKTLYIIKKIVGNNKLDALDSSKFFNEFKDNIDFILQLMLIWFRDILILKETNDENLIINSDSIVAITSISRTIETEKIDKSIHAILKTKENLSGNSNFQITIDDLILNING